jgi:hypothetical protein
MSAEGRPNKAQNSDGPSQYGSSAGRQGPRAERDQQQLERRHACRTLRPTSGPKSPTRRVELIRKDEVPSLTGLGDHRLLAEWGDMVRRQLSERGHVSART